MKKYIKNQWLKLTERLTHRKVKSARDIKVTIFGSCRQDSIYKDFKVNTIRDEITYPHYTKEIIQAAEFCMGKIKIPEELTQLCFRSGILEKKTIDSAKFQKAFNETDVFVCEIASRRAYVYEGHYVHHILSEEKYGFENWKNVTQFDLSDEEIEADIIYLKNLLAPKKILVVSHIYTRRAGRRYELIRILEQICRSHGVAFFDPMTNLGSNSPNSMLMPEEQDVGSAHYTKKGHAAIRKHYKKAISTLATPNDLEHLTVYEPAGKKQHYGSKANDGCVIIDDLNYDAFISCGINDNTDFEVAFLSKHPHLTCLAFNGTINAIPKAGNGSLIKLNKTKIGPHNTTTTTNLHNEIENHSNIFLKMDIETNEFRWIQTLTAKQISKFKQLVIVFHRAFCAQKLKGLDKQIPVDEKMDILRKISATHTLVHIHPNNDCGTTTYKKLKAPNVFECTYVRKDIEPGVFHSSRSIPSELDYQNSKNQSICLRTPPFVKTVVIHTWVLKAANLDSTHFWGIGDMLRGTIGLYQLSKKLGFDLIVDLSLHPIGKHLKQKPHKWTDTVKANKENINFIQSEHLETHIRNKITSGEHVIPLTCNCSIKIYNKPIDAECKEFLKNLLTPNKQFQFFLNENQPKLKNYTALHYRLGDNHLIHQKQENLTHLIESISRNIKDQEQYILLSDSHELKKQAPKHSNIIMYDFKPVHTGYECDESSVKYSLLEFFSVSGSNSIKTYSAYSHTSGFVMAASKIFDIPLSKIHLMKTR
jgi:hypothetical protein